MKLGQKVKQDLGKFRGMDVGALADELAKLKKEQFNLRFQQATGQLAKPSRMREVRQQIARIRTALREKRPAASV